MDPIWRNLIGNLAAVGIGILPDLLKKLDGDQAREPQRRRRKSDAPLSPVVTPSQSNDVEFQKEVNANLRREIELLKEQIRT